MPLTTSQMTAVPNLLKPLPKEIELHWRRLLNVFRDEYDRPHGDLLTPTQVQIISIIAKRKYSRVQLILPTQYGKSFSVSDGVLLRVSTHKEKWAIIAPTEDKARIIMDYIIDRVFDDDMFLRKLEYHGSKEKLKQERSKTRITFNGAGEVRVYTGNASNTQATKKSLMGFGSQNIILDESGLISDELYSTVKRMVGGYEGTEAGTFLLEIGNPFYDNHFKRTWFGERYNKVFVDENRALAEGRYTEDYLAEMRDEAFYDVLYQCLFPDATEVLANGYRRLIADAVVNNAFIDTMPPLTFKLGDNGEPLKNRWGFEIIDDNPVLGIDVSGTGANETKLVVRFPRHGFAIVAATLTSEDLEEVADKTVEVIRRWNIGDYRTVIDAGGVGHGLPAIMRRRGYLVKAVLFGETSPEKTFVNIRAYMYWSLRKWLMSDGGQLLRDPGFNEAKVVYYKRTNSDKTQIEPKEEMIKREAKDGKQVQSPDTADALVLTFVDTSTITDEDDIFVDDEVIEDEDKHTGLVTPETPDDGNPDDDIIADDDELDIM